MIESSLFSSSSNWISEPCIFEEDVKFSSLIDRDPFDLSSTNPDVYSLDRLTISSGTSSPVHSGINSDAEFGFGGSSTTFDDFNNLSLPDLMLPVPPLDYDLSDSLGLYPLDSSTIQESPLLNETDTEIEVRSSQSHYKKNPKKSSHPLKGAKSWSHMTGEEQLATVEALTQIISHQMGLREQLEVIQIINPQAVISPTDTEFIIDLASLNDTKLQQIRDYVKRHALDLPETNRTNATTSSNASTVASVSSDCSTSSSVCSGSYSKPKMTKKQAKEWRNQLKAWKQRHRKEYRQLLKERRSGLFVNEQVLSLSTGAIPDEREEDINILE